MAQALSDDIQFRVLKASAAGMSARQATARFGVGISTAIRWIARAKEGEPTAGLGCEGADGRLKKSAHALEQDRPDVLKRRRIWFDGQLDLDPGKLIFIDETGLSNKMARLRGVPFEASVAELGYRTGIGRSQTTA